jgi:polar amino acid transport system substrate-binding protein
MVWMKTIVPMLSLLCALLLGAGARAEVVNVYTSANFAPLMLGDGRGIYPDLVAYLNRRKLDGLSFRLQFMPRKRLQVKLEDSSLDGIVIGMMPEWFDDIAQKKYLWTQPFAADRFALVAPQSSAINPELPATLAGKTVGVTLGYVYPGLDDWFVRARAQRSDGLSDEKNIEKLLLGRVDSVIVAESMARYFIRTHKLGDKLRVKPMPGPGTERRFLVPHRQARTYAQIAPVIKALRDDPEWKRIVAGYE